MPKSDENQSVGYCKPPKQHRFQKGKSGNPRGRPKKSKNFVTLIDKELDETIMTMEGDKQRRITKREALAKNLVNKSITLHRHALFALLPAVEKLDDKVEQIKEREQSKDLAEEDQRMLERFIAGRDDLTNQ